MENYRLLAQDELMHHGILGMKWGIRRYQPYSTKPRASGEGGKEIGEAAKRRKSTKREVRRSIKALNDERHKKLMEIQAPLNDYADNHSERSRFEIDVYRDLTSRQIKDQLSFEKKRKDKNEDEIKLLTLLNSEREKQDKLNEEYNSRVAALKNKKTDREINREIKKDRKDAVKNRRTIDDRELRNRVKRLENEKKLRELTEEDIKPGRKKVKQILVSAGTSVATMAAVSLGKKALKKVLHKGSGQT